MGEVSMKNKGEREQEAGEPSNCGAAGLIRGTGEREGEKFG